MKKKIYLRIGKNGRRGIKVSAHTKPSFKPFTDGHVFRPKAYPTICVPVLLDVPDELFEQATTELVIKKNDVKLAIDISGFPTESEEKPKEVGD